MVEENHGFLFSYILKDKVPCGREREREKEIERERERQKLILRCPKEASDGCVI